LGLLIAVVELAFDVRREDHESTPHERVVADTKIFRRLSWQNVGRRPAAVICCSA